MGALERETTSIRSERGRGGVTGNAAIIPQTWEREPSDGKGAEAGGREPHGTRREQTRGRGEQEETCPRSPAPGRTRARLCSTPIGQQWSHA